VRYYPSFICAWRENFVDFACRFNLRKSRRLNMGFKYISPFSIVSGRIIIQYRFKSSRNHNMKSYYARMGKSTSNSNFFPQDPSPNQIKFSQKKKKRIGKSIAGKGEENSKGDDDGGNGFREMIDWLDSSLVVQEGKTEATIHPTLEGVFESALKLRQEFGITKLKPDAMLLQDERIRVRRK
jgi:hypothetical protein